MNIFVLILYRNKMAISIKEPCHEDWSKMTPTQRGAFCLSCSKEVIDFTDKSPVEIKSIFAKEFEENKKPCARITNFQLDQINDDFFKWKNDTESFKAVWIFSLIAVFGFTLFSCSSTHSKELVNQLNIDTTEMLDSLSRSDSLVAEIKTDSIPNFSNLDSLPMSVTESPWIYSEVTGGTAVLQEITLQGLPMDFPLLNIGFEGWVTCTTVLLGDLDISGMVAVEEVDEKEFKKFITSSTPITDFAPPVSSPRSTPISPVPQNPISQSQKLEGIMGPKDKQFDSFVYPNPIDPTSKLFIEVHDFLILKLVIRQLSTEQIIRSGQSTLTLGRHKMDLKLYNLPKGEYQLKLEGQNQTSILDFVV